MMTGIVKWWDEKKGYGYITVAQDNHAQDYFAHHMNIISEHRFKKLKPGWVCVFEPEKTEKGWMAKDIKMVAKDSKYFSELDETRLYLENNEY